MEMAALVLKINRSAGLGPGSAAAFAATVTKNHALVLMETRCPLVQRYARECLCVFIEFLTQRTRLCTNHRLLMAAALVRMVRRNVEQVSLFECDDENNIKPIRSKYLCPRPSVQLYWLV